MFVYKYSYFLEDGLLGVGINLVKGVTYLGSSSDSGMPGSFVAAVKVLRLDGLSQGGVATFCWEESWGWEVGVCARGFCAGELRKTEFGSVRHKFLNQEDV